MKSNKKVLYFGPLPPPTTGQSVVFEESLFVFSGDKVVVNNTFFGDNKLGNTFYSIFVLIYSFFRYNFDTVYFTCSRSLLGFGKDFILLLLSRLYKKRVINHLHGASFKHFYNNSGCLKPIIKWSYNIVETSIVLLPEMADQFSDFPCMKILILSNPYPRQLDLIDVDLSKKKKQILFLSNIIYSKGIFTFLDASLQLLSSDKNVSIRIAGVPMSDEFMSKVDVKLKFDKYYGDLKVKFGDRIKYLGGVLGDIKNELFNESSIFILPTFYTSEALPISIIESMRLGNAIITTEHNYLPHIVQKQMGFIVKKNSSSAIAERVIELFNNHALLHSMQLYNIQKAIDDYSPANYERGLNLLFKRRA